MEYPRQVSFLRRVIVRLLVPAVLPVVEPKEREQMELEPQAEMADHPAAEHLAEAPSAGSLPAFLDIPVELALAALLAFVPEPSDQAAFVRASSLGNLEQASRVVEDTPASFRVASSQAASDIPAAFVRGLAQVAFAQVASDRASSLGSLALAYPVVVDSQAFVEEVAVVLEQQVSFRDQERSWVSVLVFF